MARGRPPLKAKQPHNRKPATTGRNAAWFAGAVRLLASRCGLSEAQYRQRVLLPAIRSAEMRTPPGGGEESPELACRARRAAGTTGARTDADARRWMENATWRYLRGRRQAERPDRERAAKRRRQERGGRKGTGDRRPRNERRQRRPPADVDAEQKRLEAEARQREEERIAGIEARRLHARRAVVGLEAWRLAEREEAASASWALERWRQVRAMNQEACWSILRPALGLKPGSFRELLQRWRRTRERTESGAEPAPDQQVAARRRQWRRRRVRAWVRIGRRVLDNAEKGHDTAANAIRACIDPRVPMP